MSGRRNKKGRSAEQRPGNAAMTQVMSLWEALSDPERLAWNIAGRKRRMRGINYFKMVNLRRAGRGEELARVPPQSKPRLHGASVLKGLDIRNRGGRITLKLEFLRAPPAQMTVWGARPCNRGLAKPDKCPRLGWLPGPKEGLSDITELYFQKHGEYIKAHRLQLAGLCLGARL